MADVDVNATVDSGVDVNANGDSQNVGTPQNGNPEG